jgi:hypothetical protein
MFSFKFKVTSPRLSRKVIIIGALLFSGVCGLYLPYARTVFTEVRSQQAFDAYLYPGAEFVTEMQLNTAVNEPGWLTKRRVYWTADSLETVQIHYLRMEIAPTSSTDTSHRYRIQGVPEVGMDFTFMIEEAAPQVRPVSTATSTGSGTLITYNMQVWESSVIAVESREGEGAS